MKLGRLLLLVALALTVSTSASQAQLFEGLAIGAWTNVVSTDPGDIYTVANNDAGGNALFEWGTPAGGSFTNQFHFDGVGSDGGAGWSSLTETAFVIGSFDYRNGATFNSVGIDGVSLDIALTITNPLGYMDTFMFDYMITNTPNTTGDPVLDGDIVTVDNVQSETFFNYNGTNYTLELLGFSDDGGNTITTDFSSPEGATAAADVYAKITSDVQAIPEPSTVVILGFGLVGVALLRRRFI